LKIGKLKQSKLSVNTSLDRFPKVSNIKISQFDTNNTSILNEGQEKEGNNESGSLNTAMKEVLTPRTGISFKFSSLPGLDNCNIPQVLKKLSGYLDKHETNPRPTHLMIFVNKLVNLCEEIKDFELEFHSK